MNETCIGIFNIIFNAVMMLLYVKFMEGIAGLIRDLLRQNTAPNPAYSSLFGNKNAANREAVGTCPRCGGAVCEG